MYGAGQGASQLRPAYLLTFVPRARRDIGAGDDSRVVITTASHPATSEARHSLLSGVPREPWERNPERLRG